MVLSSEEGRSRADLLGRGRQGYTAILSGTAGRRGCSGLQSRRGHGHTEMLYGEEGHGNTPAPSLLLGRAWTERDHQENQLLLHLHVPHPRLSAGEGEEGEEGDKEYDDYNWSPTAAYTHTRPLQLYFYDMTPLHAQILFDIAYGHILIFYALQRHFT